MRRLIGCRARDAIATIVAEIKHVRHLADSTDVSLLRFAAGAIALT
jgi:hypothetical protein